MGKGRQPEFTAEQVIEAIRGSGGIQAAIARKLGCHRHTVENYLGRYATARQAYEDECQATDDAAESVVIQNIRLASKIQEETGQPVDSSDSKWWLERRRRDKFSPRQEITGVVDIPVDSNFEHALKRAYGENESNDNPNP